MMKFYQFGTTIFATLAALAALGAGARIVATAVVIGGLLAVAAKLAISGAARAPKGRAADVDSAVSA